MGVGEVSAYLQGDCLSFPKEPTSLLLANPTLSNPEFFPVGPPPLVYELLMFAVLLSF